MGVAVCFTCGCISCVSVWIALWAESVCVCVCVTAVQLEEQRLKRQLLGPESGSRSRVTRVSYFHLLSLISSKMEMIILPCLLLGGLNAQLGDKVPH